MIRRPDTASAIYRCRVISVEGNTVTTEVTGTLPAGTKVRPTSVYEVSDDGLVTSIQFIEGPVVTDEG